MGSKSTVQYSGESGEMEESSERLEVAAILMQLHLEDLRFNPGFKLREQEHYMTFSYSTIANAGTAGEKGDITGKKKPADNTNVRGLKETVNNAGRYMNSFHAPTSCRNSTDPETFAPAAPANNVQVPHRILNYNITRADSEYSGDQIPSDGNRSPISAVTAIPIAPAIVAAIPLAPANVTQKRNQEGRTCKCSHCFQFGHQRRTCPWLPCMNCNLMGHVSRYCPDLVKDRARWRSEATRRYNKKKRATRRWTWLLPLPEISGSVCTFMLRAKGFRLCSLQGEGKFTSLIEKWNWKSIF